jgi:basic membrane protein A
VGLALAATPLAATFTFRVPGTLAQDEIVVTMVTDTLGLGDQNFNDLAKRGLDQAAADFGIRGEVIESRDAAAYIPNLTQAAEQSDLTLAVGFLLIDAVTEVAAQYPDNNFLLIDAVVEADNVASVLFKENEAAFLAGLAAGLSTETNQIGVLGGLEIPPVIRYEVGFEAGVRSVNPDAEVTVSYVGNFDDVALGKELTLAMYNQGADIVLAAAGRAGIGSFDAAKEKGEGFWVVAADTDQSQLGAEHQLVVATKGVDTAVYTVAEQVVNGSFQGGIQNLGLVEDGVGLESPGGFISEENMALIDRYRQAVIDGTIVVPADRDELAAFTPMAPDELPEGGASPEADATPAA